MTENCNHRLCVGIDIAAKTFSAAWGIRVDQITIAQTFSQTGAGRKAALKKLKATGFRPEQTLIVMEATGTYWMQLAVSLHQHGYGVCVINPRQAHHFAEATLKQAKTDAVDAQTLTHLGLTLPLAPWEPPTGVWQALYQRLVEHDNLTDMRQMLRNQLHALCHRSQVDPAVQARKQQLIDEIEQQLKSIKQELEAWLQQSEWVELAKRLRSIPGIGLLSTAWLLIITNGFTTCEDAEQLTSYLGLVPHPRQSGTSRRGHRGVGRTGHARGRRVMHQAAISATNHNPTIKTFYQRLLARGKPVKVARCAAARKLVHIAFAVVTKERVYDPQHHLACQKPLVA